MTDELRTTQPTGRMNTVPNYEEAVSSLQARRDLILAMMGKTLEAGIHYGKIPGCGDKPSLFLAGAEQLASTFNFAPRYKKTATREGMHLIVDIVCELYLPDGTFIGEGVSMRSTYETKYRYRAAVGESTGQSVPKKYWDLRGSDPKAAQVLIGEGNTVAKVDANGVPTKDKSGTWAICTRGEKTENPDLADVWNTVLKMGAKSAFVHAVRTATGTADIFTQDIEDFNFIESYGTVIDVDVTSTEPAPPVPEPTKAPTKSASVPPPVSAAQSAEEPPRNDVPWPDDDSGAPSAAPNPAPAPAPTSTPAPAAAKSTVKPAPKPRPATAAPVEDVNSPGYEAKARAAIVRACRRFQHAYEIQNVADPKAAVIKIKEQIAGTVRYPEGANEFQRRAIVADAMEKRADYLGLPPLPEA